MLPIPMIGPAESLPVIPNTQYMDGIGGEIYLRGSYKYHYFTASGTFQVTQVGYDPTEGNVIEFLLVGGGGGGGRGANIDTGGGGGGAGEFVTGSYNVSVGTYACTVGAGGLGAPTHSLFSGSNGTSSLITPVTALGYPLVAIGGGYGTGFRYYLGTPPNFLSSSFGGDGGSGGGSTYTSNLDSTVYGGEGVFPKSGSNYNWRGYDSGQGRPTGQVPGRPGIDNPLNYGGGAGGGATQVGGGPRNYYKNFGEYYNGGTGNFWELDYFNGRYYAGGGAAGVDGTPLTDVIIAGGNGGGGTAGRGGISNAGNGTPNTGGGGGGAGYWDSITNAGNGGSGIAAIRYRYQ